MKLIERPTTQEAQSAPSAIFFFIFTGFQQRNVHCSVLLSYAALGANDRTNVPREIVSDTFLRIYTENKRS